MHATASARWLLQSTSPSTSALSISNTQTPSPSSPFAFALCSSATFVDLLLVVGVEVLVLCHPCAWTVLLPMYLDCILDCTDWTSTSTSRSEREREKPQVIEIYPYLDALRVPGYRD